MKFTPPIDPFFKNFIPNQNRTTDSTAPANGEMKINFSDHYLHM